MFNQIFGNSMSNYMGCTNNISGDKHNELYFTGILNTSQNFIVATKCLLAGNIIVGSVNAESIETDGLFGANALKANLGKLNGNVKVDEISISSLAIDGNIICNSLIGNNLEGKGTCSSKEISIKDNLSFTGNFNTKELTGNNVILVGAINVEKILASQIKIKMEDPHGSEIKSIEAQNVEANSGKKLARLICNTIKGDNISVDNTTAESIVGKKITIGENCEVSEILYSEEVTIHDSAKVSSCIKTNI